MSQTQAPGKGLAPLPKMKVTILCHSDKLGGAAVVTYRLMRALRNMDIDARMIVFSKQTADSNVTKISSRFMRGMNFLGERARIFAANKFNRDTLFQVSIANTGFDISKHPWVREADVVMLSWINQGMLSLNDIRKIGRLGKPLVWTMHDMWNLTGICHHSRGCRRFVEECGCCPFLDSNNPYDLSHQTWKRKKRLYAEVPIAFVAVSSWLQEQCRESSLLKDARVVTIPNAFPAESFYTRPRSLRPRLPVDYTKNLILMGAARLDDPIKDFPTAIKAFNHIFMNHPEVANKCMAVFFGEIRDSSLLDKIHFPYVHLGRISDESILRELYSISSVVLSTSLYETLPGTLIEGQAAGCVPVTTGQGGQTDIIDHLVNGYIAEDNSPETIAKGILWALENTPDRNELHTNIESRFDAPVVAQKYADLFHRLLAGQ